MLAPTPSNSPGSYQQKLFISDKTPCQQKMLKCDPPNAERVAPFWTKPKASLPNSLAWDCRQWSILRKADGKCRKKQSRPSKTHYIMPASISSTRMVVAPGCVCASDKQKRARRFKTAAPPPHATLVIAMCRNTQASGSGLFSSLTAICQADSQI